MRSKSKEPSRPVTMTDMFRLAENYHIPKGVLEAIEKTRKMFEGYAPKVEYYPDTETALRRLAEKQRYIASCLDSVNEIVCKFFSDEEKVGLIAILILAMGKEEVLTAYHIADILEQMADAERKAKEETEKE